MGVMKWWIKGLEMESWEWSAVRKYVHTSGVGQDGRDEKSPGRERVGGEYGRTVEGMET